MIYPHIISSLCWKFDCFLSEIKELRKSLHKIVDKSEDFLNVVKTKILLNQISSKYYNYQLNELKSKSIFLKIRKERGPLTAQEKKMSFLRYW